MRHALRLMTILTLAIWGGTAGPAAADEVGGVQGSLSERIRQNRHPVQRSIQPAQPTPEPRSSSQRLQLVNQEVDWLDSGSEDPDQRRREELTQRHLQRLNRPLTEVAIGSRASDQPTPEDRAAGLLESKPAVHVGALSIGPMLPDRYPITMYHGPLYFEQPDLERCGNACGCLQNAVSAAQFLAHTTVLPYQICRHRNEPCVAAGGDCQTCQQIRAWRPGDCLPLDARALTIQAASMAGFSFLFL